MSKKNQKIDYVNYIASVGPVSTVIFGLVIYAGLGSLLFDYIGDKQSGYFIVVYSIISIIICIWSSSRSKGLTRIVSLMSIAPLVALLLFGSFVVQFSDYQF